MSYINIGHTQKSHGLQGELKLHIEEAYLEDFLKNERIFIDVKGTKIPYFIENVRGTGGLILKLEDVDDRDAAYGLQSRQVYLREKDLVPLAEREIEVEEDTLQYAYLQGFMLREEVLGDIGLIDEVLEMPQQEMAFLKYKKREVLIPLNPQLVLHVDEKAQTVLMRLPDGLLEV
jgi:16S rRNA processing protein RimM